MEDSRSALSLRHAAAEQHAALERERDEARQEVLAVYQRLAIERRAFRARQVRGSAGLGALVGTAIGTVIAVATGLPVFPLAPAWILSAVFAFGSLAVQLKSNPDNNGDPTKYHGGV